MSNNNIFSKKLFSNRLKKALKKNNIVSCKDKQEFCDKIYISYSTLKNYLNENSTNDLSVSFLYILATNLNVTTDYLVGLQDKENNN